MSGMTGKVFVMNGMTGKVFVMSGMTGKVDAQWHAKPDGWSPRSENPSNSLKLCSFFIKANPFKRYSQGKVTEFASYSLNLHHQC